MRCVFYYIEKRGGKLNKRIQQRLETALKAIDRALNALSAENNLTTLAAEDIAVARDNVAHALQHLYLRDANGEKGGDDAESQKRDNGEEAGEKEK
jgi:hypothetical protein